MRRTMAIATLAVTATLATLLLPALASAGEGRGNQFFDNAAGTYVAADGEVNNVVVTGTGTGVTITDTAGATVGTGAGETCSQINPTTIHCIGNMSYTLGNQNDTLSFAGGAVPPHRQFFLDVRGGAGSDNISGSPLSDVILGGAGSSNDNSGDGPDVLRGGDGADVINGDEGNDTVLGEGGDDEPNPGFGLEGGAGNDIVDGGPGNDYLAKSFHGGGCSGPDTMIGGPGKDRFSASCGEPTLKFRDGEKDSGHCAEGVTSAVKEYDALEQVYGDPACHTFVTTCKKKGRKGKKKGKTASAAKKKKKKCKREPYKPPEPDPDAPSSPPPSTVGV